MHIMTELGHRKRVRGGHRASATKMMRKAEELLSREEPNLAELAKLKLSLQEKLVVLKTLDTDIVHHVKEDDIAEEIEETDTYMEDVYATMAKLDQLAITTTSALAAPVPAAPVIRGPPSLDTKVKLPKLTIQPFKGELTTWTTFWDSYHAAIDANTSLSKIDKFNYLRSLLQGSALDAIAGLSLTEANYPEAIAILKEHFGNRQQIID